MTRAEKQELRKLIQMLPQRNLNRVVEIVQHSKLAETRSSGELFVDLEQEVKAKRKKKRQEHDIECSLDAIFNLLQNIVFQDNVTLWRLYYYVKAVEKAGELLV